MIWCSRTVQPEKRSLEFEVIASLDLARRIVDVGLDCKRHDPGTLTTDPFVLLDLQLYATLLQ